MSGRRYRTLPPERRREILDSLRRVLESSGVLLAVVFGSFVEMSSFHDVDVAVYGLGDDLDRLSAVSAAFEEKTGIPLDIVPLAKLPPASRIRVLSRGLVIVERVPGLYEALLMRAWDDVIRAEIASRPRRTSAETRSQASEA